MATPDKVAKAAPINMDVVIALTTKNRSEATSPEKMRSLITFPAIFNLDLYFH